MIQTFPRLILLRSDIQLLILALLVERVHTLLLRQKGRDWENRPDDDSESDRQEFKTREQRFCCKAEQTCDDQRIVSDPEKRRHLSITAARRSPSIASANRNVVLSKNRIEVTSKVMVNLLFN